MVFRLAKSFGRMPQPQRQSGEVEAFRRGCGTGLFIASPPARKTLGFNHISGAPSGLSIAIPCAAPASPFTIHHSLFTIHHSPFTIHPYVT
jgi:hypothetical protein